MGHLHGTRVLDLGIWRPAPYATQLLVELGAEVIKVEPPGGDPMRAFPSLYRALNAGKAVEECDLKTEVGRTRTLQLAAEADVVVEGFRPGVTDRLGVGEPAVRVTNPSVIYCSVSGFGQDGPLAAAPGHDLNYQAWTGVLASRRPEISRPGVPLADLAGGAYAAMAICAALAGRATTGEGDRIDVSMADILLTWAGEVAGGPLASGDDPGSAFPAYGTFVCADGEITLGIVTEDGWWQALCRLVGLDDLSTLDAAQRAVDGRALRRQVDAAIAPHQRDRLVADLLSAGVPVAPVLARDEALGHPQFAARGVVEIGGDAGARLGHPVRHERHPAVPAGRPGPTPLAPGATFEPRG